MKRLNKIFLWAFIVLSLLPLAEFVLFQWRNDNRIGLDSTSSISVVSYPSGSNSGYVVYYLPTEINSFTDYIVSEYTYGIIDNSSSVNLHGLAKPLFMSMALFMRQTGTSTSSGPVQMNIICIALLIARSAYIAGMLLMVYLMVFPVALCFTFFRRRTHEKP